MTTVRVVRMGPLVPACDVARLVHAANRSQAFYHFEAGDPVQSLGIPRVKMVHTVSMISSISS